MPKIPLTDADEFTSPVSKPTGLVDLISVSSLTWSIQPLANRTRWLYNQIINGVNRIIPKTVAQAQAMSSAVVGDLVRIKYTDAGYESNYGLYVCQDSSTAATSDDAPAKYQISGTTKKWVNVAIAAAGLTNAGYHSSGLGPYRPQTVATVGSNGFVEQPSSSGIVSDVIYDPYEATDLVIPASPTWTSYSWGISTSSKSGWIHDFSLSLALSGFPADFNTYSKLELINANTGALVATGTPALNTHIDTPSTITYHVRYTQPATPVQLTAYLSLSGKFGSTTGVKIAITNIRSVTRAG
jgi:hypothetical protein